MLLYVKIEMGNMVPTAYDRPRGDESLSHEYFVKRGQGDLHYAWLWLKYVAQNKTKFYPEPPSEFLVTAKAEDLYAVLKDSEEFEVFVKWMEPIPV